MSGQLAVPSMTPLAARLADRMLAGRLPARPPQGAWPRTVFIDGRSGSGKTTLAEAIVERLVAQGLPAPQIVGMDELYPGWDGLAAGSAAVPGLLRSGVYRRYDWHAEDFSPEVTLDREAPLIIEGCGSISARALAAARHLGPVYAVWVECPANVRRERALARDGEVFIPHWERWAEQEVRHFASTQPVARAHEVVHVAG